MKKYLLGVFMILLTSMITVPQLAYAEQNHTFQVMVASHLNFNPEIKSYYDLIVTTGETVQLPFKIENSGTEESTFELSFNPALTNRTGSIEYSGATDSQLVEGTPSIKEHAHLSQSNIRLKPGESKEFTLKITAPKEKFEGKIAGGVRIFQVPNNNATGNIRHTFSREIAVILQNEPTTIQPDIQFLKANVAGETRRKYLLVDMANVAPVYLSRGKIDYTIRKGNETVLEQSKNLRLSPSTQFHYQIPLNDLHLIPGDYQVDLTVTSETNTWHNTLNFAVKPEIAKAINAVNETTAPPLPYLTILLIGLIVVLLAVIILLLVKKKKIAHE